MSRLVQLVITADYQNKVQEANEENNSSTLDIATVRPLPHLLPASMWPYIWEMA
jgi:subtilase family serine protease